MRNFKDWFFEGENIDHAAAGVREGTHHPQHPWWQVLCLTGVDYFSTLGYQPGIAALAAGALAPMATMLLVLLTLFGAVPIYSRVARQSPRGEGSIAMLEHLLRWWQGKLLVLVLLGFAATDFIITMTLSAADATAHIIENPFAPAWAPHYRVVITLFLLGLLGAVFLKGFKEAISIAVIMVGLYLGLNFIVVAVGLAHVFMHPEYLSRWHYNLLKQAPSLTDMLAGSIIVFPRLALDFLVLRRR